MASNADILKTELDKGVRALQDNLARAGRNVTGGTSNSIKSTVTTEGSKVIGTITASQVLRLLQDGRQRTRNGTKGQSEWYEDLKRWVIARGIPVEATYPIFKKINEQGFEGTPGLIDSVLDILEENILKAITENTAENITNRKHDRDWETRNYPVSY